MNAPVLRLCGVAVRYGTTPALWDFNLDLSQGEIVGLLGPNGSGKSTALAVAAGLIEPDQGRVLLNGQERGSDPHRFAEAIGFVPQGAALYDELTAAQNLEFFGQLYGFTGADLDARVARGLARARLSDRADDRVHRFSGGLKQRLSIACARMHEPVVLLLDEPSSALDAASRDMLLTDLLRLRDDGHAILLTTHHADEAEHICDRVVRLDGGRMMPRSAREHRPLLYGHLRASLPGYVRRGLEEKLNSGGVEFEVIGRRVRLAAPTNDELGRALATLLAEGATLEVFRTPARRMASCA